MEIEIGNPKNNNNNNKKKRNQLFSHYGNEHFTKKKSTIVYDFSDTVRRRYRACGVLVIATDPKTKRKMLLLGYEDRTKKMNRHNTALGYFWLHFQGKRDDIEHDPCVTAFREFKEETGNVLQLYHDSIEKQMKDKEKPKIWYPINNYVLFIVYVPFDEHAPTRFDRLCKQTLKDNYQLELRWVPALDLCFQWVNRSRNINYCYLYDTGKIQHIMYPFFCILIKLWCTKHILMGRNQQNVLYRCDFIDDWRKT